MRIRRIGLNPLNHLQYNLKKIIQLLWALDFLSKKKWKEENSRWRESYEQSPGGKGDRRSWAWLGQRLHIKFLKRGDMDKIR